MISRREFLLRSAATGAGLAAFSNRTGALEAQKILELAGTRAPSSGTYTRMFPNLPPQGANNPHLQEGLIELGEKMRDDSNEIIEVSSLTLWAALSRLMPRFEGLGFRVAFFVIFQDRHPAKAKATVGRADHSRDPLTLWLNSQQRVSACQHGCRCGKTKGR